MITDTTDVYSIWINKHTNKATCHRIDYNLHQKNVPRSRPEWNDIISHRIWPSLFRLFGYGDFLDGRLESFLVGDPVDDVSNAFVDVRVTAAHHCAHTVRIVGIELFLVAARSDLHFVLACETGQRRAEIRLPPNTNSKWLGCSLPILRLRYCSHVSPTLPCSELSTNRDFLHQSYNCLAGLTNIINHLDNPNLMATFLSSMSSDAYFVDGPSASEQFAVKFPSLSVVWIFSDFTIHLVIIKKLFASLTKSWPKSWVQFIRLKLNLLSVRLYTERI